LNEREGERQKKRGREREEKTETKKQVNTQQNGTFPTENGVSLYYFGSFG